jgi:signal transduction histidine kinase
VSGAPRAAAGTPGWRAVPARALIGTVTGVAAAAGLGAAWAVPPPPSGVWTVIWELLVGGGCAVAGVILTGTDRAADLGRLLTAGALLLFAGPVVLAAGWPDLSDALWLAVVLVLLPLATLRVVTPRPAAVATSAVAPAVAPVVALAAMRAVDGAVAVAGGIAVVATAAGQPVVTGIAATVCAVVVLVAGWLLFELTTGDGRRQVLWLILGFALTAPTSLLTLVVVGVGGIGVIALAVAAGLLSLSLPTAITVAAVNPRLLDVREIIERLTVLTLMVVLAMAVYVGGAASFEAVTGRVAPRGVQVLLMVTVAVAFHPTLRWLRSSVDEMLFGGRADPVDTLARLGTHLAAGSPPPEWLETLRTALAVQGVALRRRGEVIASAGVFGDAVTVMTPLTADAEHVGDLVVALPAEHLRPPPTTVAVLGLVAAPLAQALHAAGLAEELRASRGRVVSGLEEERRRMRRDLHDGLGPTLTGIAYSADAAANLVHADPDQARDLLRQLRGDARAAIAEIRRIVYGLRPKALDELGLVGAMRQQVSHLRTADGRVLVVDVAAPADLPHLPAAVEVAAYRVAVEAVTNVARHAGVAAASVDLTLCATPASRVLRVEVRDRGRTAGGWVEGIGIASMRERVEQIGGAFALRAGVDGATVTADLPLEIPAPPGEPT